MNDIKLININQITSQLIKRKLALYSSTYLGNDIYYLFEAVDMIMKVFGEDSCKKVLGEEKYKESKNILNYFKLSSTKVKSYYDPIENKTFWKNKKMDEVQSVIRNYFISTSSKMSLLHDKLWEILIPLINSCTLRNQEIGIELFKILEHRGHRTIDLSRRRPIESSGEKNLVKEEERE